MHANYEQGECLVNGWNKYTQTHWQVYDIEKYFTGAEEKYTADI